MAQTELTYFIKSGSFVKIGKTNNLKNKFDILQHANPIELEVLGVTFEKEYALHEKFVYLRERGEWFHLTNEIHEYITEYTACPDQDGNLGEIPEEGGKRDFDVIAVGKSKAPQDRIKSIRDIVKELEREKGSAPLGVIIERAKKLGIEEDAATAEITKLVQEAAIYEKVRYSDNYCLTQL